MNNSKKQKIFHELAYTIIPIIIITVLGLIFITDNKSIKILGDEFGYWMSAAWMTGKNWSDVASINAYYGYGYGILLSFILILPITSILKYQIAILFNILMLIFVYLIVYFLLTRVVKCAHQYLSILALTVTLYTGNLYHSQFTMIETLFLLGFWCFILLLYHLSKNYRIYKVLLGVVLLAYLYSSHHRALSIVFAGFICLLCIQIREKKYRDIFILFLFATLLLLGAEWIKNIYQHSYLTNEYVSLMHYNDYSGQVAKVTTLASLNGLISLLTGVIGKFFYLLSSTYLLGGIAIYKIIKDLILLIKKKHLTTSTIIELFILITTISSIGITSIFFIDYQHRFELLIYGRYHEFFVSALILIGLLSLFQSERINKKHFIIICLTYVISLLITDNMIPHGAPEDYSHLFSSGIFDTLDLYDNNLYAVGIKTYIIFGVIVLLTHYFKNHQKKTGILATCILLSILWSGTYFYTYKESVLSWVTTYDRNELALTDFIKILGCENDLYFYAREGHDIDHLQFILEDANIKCVFTQEQIDNLPSDAYLITRTQTHLYENNMLDNFEPLTQSSRLQLWQHKN